MDLKRQLRESSKEEDSTRYPKDSTVAFQDDATSSSTHHHQEDNPLEENNDLHHHHPSPNASQNDHVSEMSSSSSEGLVGAQSSVIDEESGDGKRKQAAQKRALCLPPYVFELSPDSPFHGIISSIHSGLVIKFTRKERVDDRDGFSADDLDDEDDDSIRPSLSGYGYDKFDSSYLYAITEPELVITEVNEWLWSTSNPMANVKKRLSIACLSGNYQTVNIVLEEDDVRNGKSAVSPATPSRSALFLVQMNSARFLPYIVWSSSLVSTVSSFINFSYRQTQYGRFGDTELQVILILTLIKCIQDCFYFYYFAKNQILELVDSYCACCCNSQCRQDCDQSTDCNICVEEENQDGDTGCSKCCVCCCFSILAEILGCCGNCKTSELSDEESRFIDHGKMATWKMVADFISMGVIICNIRILASLKVAGVFRDYMDVLNSNSSNNELREYVRTLYISLLGSAISLVLQRVLSFILVLWDRWIHAYNIVESAVAASRSPVLKSSSSIVLDDANSPTNRNDISSPSAKASAQSVSIPIEAGSNITPFSSGASSMNTEEPADFHVPMLSVLRRFVFEWARVNQSTATSSGPYSLQKLLCMIVAFAMLRVNYDLFFLKGSNSHFAVHSLYNWSIAAFVLTLFSYSTYPEWIEYVHNDASIDAPPEDTWITAISSCSGVWLFSVSYLVMVLNIVISSLIIQYGYLGEQLFHDSVLLILILSSICVFVQTFFITKLVGSAKFYGGYGVICNCECICLLCYELWFGKEAGCLSFLCFKGCWCRRKEYGETDEEDDDHHARTASISGSNHRDEHLGVQLESADCQKNQNEHDQAGLPNVPTSSQGDDDDN